MLRDDDPPVEFVFGSISGSCYRIDKCVAYRVVAKQLKAMVTGEGKKPRLLGDFEPFPCSSVFRYHALIVLRTGCHRQRVRESSVCTEERRAIGTHDSLAFGSLAVRGTRGPTYSLTTFSAMRSWTSTNPTGLPS